MASHRLKFRANEEMSIFLYEKADSIDYECDIYVEVNNVIFVNKIQPVRTGSRTYYKHAVTNSQLISYRVLYIVILGHRQFCF